MACFIIISVPLTFDLAALVSSKFFNPGTLFSLTKLSPY